MQLGRLWLVAAIALIVAGCKQEGGVKVTGFDLIGVHAFSANDVLKVLATQKTSWIPGSTPHYFDRADFEADLKRIEGIQGPVTTSPLDATVDELVFQHRRHRGDDESLGENLLIGSLIYLL